MKADVVQSSEPTSGGTSARAGANRRPWRQFMPRTATLIPSVLTLFWILVGLREYVNGWFENADLAVVFTGLVGLLVLDRVDEWCYWPHPRRWVAALLLVLRVTLIEGVAWGVGANWYWRFLIYPMIPYVTTLYFGARAGYLVAGAAWITVAAMMMVAERAQGWWHISTGAGITAIPLVLAIVLAQFVRLEVRRHAEVERLLGDLRRARLELETAAARTLHARNERTRFARHIHDLVDRALVAVNHQLETAHTTGDENAVRTAKQVASQALLDVRRSVAALRASTDDLGVRRDGLAMPTVLLRTHPARRWRRWFLVDTGDLVHSLCYLLLLVLYSVTAGPLAYPAVWQRFLVASPLLGLLMLDCVEGCRFGATPPIRLGFGVAVVRLVLVGAFMRFALVEMSIAMLFLAPHIAVRYTALGGDRRLGWVLTSLTAILIAVPIVREWQQAAGSGYVQATLNTLGIILLVLLGWVASRAALNECTARHRAERLLQELQAAYDKLRVSTQRELATVEERNQLARDIHDGLGHYLTVVNVQLEKALAFRDRDPALADQALRDAGRLAGEAFREVRTSVGVLDRAQHMFSLTRALQALVANVGADLPVDLRIVGNETGFAPPVLMALYRVAQEGLTNVQKHADASRVELLVTLDEQDATLDVRDNGRGFDPAAQPGLQTTERGCSGLLGLRERLELVGGSMQIVSTPAAGTHLHAVVPRTALVGGVPAPTEPGS